MNKWRRCRRAVRKQTKKCVWRNVGRNEGDMWKKTLLGKQLERLS